MRGQGLKLLFTKRVVSGLSYFVVIVLTLAFFYITDFSFIKNDYYYFVLTAGLETILIFISEFLEHRLCDGISKEDYYLGKNLKHKKYYENPFIYVFNTFPARIFLWVTAIIPLVILLPHIKTHLNWLNDIYSWLIQFFPLLKSIWCSTYVVVLFVCISVLIETIVLNRGVFSGEGTYSETNEENDKNDIRIQIEREYSQVFSKNLSLLKVLRFADYLKIPDDISVNKLISETNNRTGGKRDEFAEYFAIAYSCEFQKINNYIDIIINNKLIPSFIKQRILSFVRHYYRIKWQEMDDYPNGIIPSIDWIRIAKNDMTILLKCEKNFSNDKDYLGLFCRELYKKNSNRPVGGETQSNKIVVLILDALIKQLQVNHDHSIDCGAVYVVALLDTLHLYDTAEEVRTKEKNEYCRRTIEGLLRLILEQEYWDSPLSNKVRKMLKSDNRKWIEYNFANIIKGDDELSSDAIEYIIHFFDYTPRILLLLYRLAYNNRCGRGYIQVEEFRKWRNAIKPFVNSCKLTAEEVEEGYHSIIEESSISHFLNHDDIVWICESLSSEINDAFYNEFQTRISSKFSFPSYVIVRLILDPYSLYKINNLKDSKWIKESLVNIEEILSEQGMNIIHNQFT